MGFEVSFTKQGGKNLKGFVKILSHKHDLKILFTDLKVLDIV